MTRAPIVRRVTARRSDARAAAFQASLAAITAVLTIAVGCGNPISNGDRVPAGTWGGPGIRLDVTSAGAAIEYDCAHGTIDEPLVTDRDGRFTLTGTHVREHGGPVRQDEPPDRHPARYRGQMSGDSLRLIVTLADTQQD